MTEPVFVGRERELARLRGFLAKAMAGRGQVVFVSGEAGSGKTALLNAFAEDAQPQDENLIVAVGGCSAQGGVGDPYLPFREVLSSLVGATEGDAHQGLSASRRLGKLLVRGTQVLVEVGPDLINTLIPGTGLLGKIGKVALEKGGWMDQLERLARNKPEPVRAHQTAMEQGRILEQYANVLKTIAAEHTLLIVIDDMQWADEASISLFFHLSRRLEASRIVLVGTYRPDEIEAVGGARHPLEKVLFEIKRYAGDVWIDLGDSGEAERKAFVSRLLDSEPNRLDQHFRQQVYERTGGQALFTVELLRTMQERGNLVRDAEGRWVVGATLEWDSLPARVEGVIEERINRLSASEREILDIASVQGEVFTAEVVGRIAQMQMRQMLRELSQELERQYRLVREAGALKAGRVLLSAYQFAHALFQHYLYAALGAAEKRLLHVEIAQALEELYTGQIDQVSAQLAWHYDQAGDAERAVPHLLRSGELSNAQGAPRAARDCFDRALELLGEILPNDVPHDIFELRWRGLLGRHTALLRIGDPEALRADTRALTELAEQLADPRRQAEAAYRSLLEANVSGDPQAVLTAADQAVTVARTAGAVTLEARSLHIEAATRLRLGETEAADAAARAALERARQSGDATVLANALSGLGTHHSYTGDLSRAVAFQLEALEQARRGTNRVSEARTLANLGDDYRRLGLYDQALAALEQALRANEAVGARRERAYVLVNLAATHLGRGEAATARPLLEQALAESLEVGDQYLRAEATKLLGYTQEALGDQAAAERSFHEAQAQLSALGLTPSALEAVAGLARLAQGQPDLARGHAQALWEYLGQHGMGSLVPEAHLACAQVFAALNEPGIAREVIEGGHRDLIERADRISDPEWRRSFLENVPENAQLVRQAR